MAYFEKVWQTGFHSTKRKSTVYEVKVWPVYLLQRQLRMLSKHAYVTGLQLLEHLSTGY
jgi:hypothetical protein